MADGKNILIEVNNLKKYFPVKTGFMKMNYVKAVDDVSFYIEKGETLGLVGESGCGKTTLAVSYTHLDVYKRQGIANRETGEVVYSGPMVWNHVPFGKELQKQFPGAQTVSVAELAGCTALGESLAGAALRCTQVVLFQFGAGISSGVVVDGRIFGGKYCAGARLGHCTIVSGGKTCSCGRKGCFEAYASLEALAEQAREAAARYKNTLLGRYDALTISPAEVMDCARKEMCIRDRACRHPPTWRS